jgi:hypothetical protein
LLSYSICAEKLTKPSAGSVAAISLHKNSVPDCILPVYDSDLNNSCALIKIKFLRLKNFAPTPSY